jgi:hypothetical protein
LEEESSELAEEFRRSGLSRPTALKFLDVLGCVYYLAAELGLSVDDMKAWSAVQAKRCRPVPTDLRIAAVLLSNADPSAESSLATYLDALPNYLSALRSMLETEGGEP